MIYSDFLDDAALKRYAQAMNSRAKSAGLAQYITAETLRDCIYRSGGQCGWCTASLIGRAFELDHIISLSNGGSNTAENLAVSCPDCNRRKAAKHPATFAQETITKSGVITPLIQRVLDHYGIEATIQRGLFDDPSSTASSPELHEDDADDPPPYVWGQHP